MNTKKSKTKTAAVKRISRPTKKAEKVLEPLSEAVIPSTLPIEPLPVKTLTLSFPVSRKNIYIGVGTLAGAVLLVVLILFHNHQTALLLERSRLKASLNSNAADPAQQLIAQVGQLMVLPSNEQPTIATVSDLSKLKGQAFFQNAKEGDKVLIYPINGKAILYRPSENKIIELAPITTASQSDKPTVAGTETVSLEIRNGTGKPGVAAAFESKLQQDSGFSVTQTGTAKKVYPKSVLFIGNQELTPQILHLQSMSGASLATVMPAGEPASGAQVLLIIGQN